MGRSGAFNANQAVLLTAGETIISRDMVNGDTAVASGSLRLTYFTAQRSEAITQMRMYSGTVAAGPIPTLARFGVYGEDPVSGDLTLLAAIANDVNLFAAASTPYLRALTSTFNKVRGARYAVGDIVVTAAAMPRLQGIAFNSGFVDYGDSPRLSGQVAGQADLPANVAAGIITASGVRRYAALLQ